MPSAVADDVVVGNDMAVLVPDEPGADAPGHFLHIEAEPATAVLGQVGDLYQGRRGLLVDLDSCLFQLGQVGRGKVRAVAFTIFRLQIELVRSQYPLDFIGGKHADGPLG